MALSVVVVVVGVVVLVLVALVVVGLVERTRWLARERKRSTRYALLGRLSLAEAGTVNTAETAAFQLRVRAWGCKVGAGKSAFWERAT